MLVSGRAFVKKFLSNLNHSLNCILLPWWRKFRKICIEQKQIKNRLNFLETYYLAVFVVTDYEFDIKFIISDPKNYKNNCSFLYFNVQFFLGFKMVFMHTSCKYSYSISISFSFLFLQSSDKFSIKSSTSIFANYETELLIFMN